MKRQDLSSRAIIIIVAGLLLFTSVVCGFGTQPEDIEATVAAAVAATRQAEVDLRITIEAAVAATEAANQLNDQIPNQPTSAPNPPVVSDAELVRATILNEVNGTVARDLSLLESLYAPDAVIIDRNGTPNEPGDDTTWAGWVNIERRYQAFFTSDFNSISLVNLSIQVNGDQATATHQGVVLDGTLYPDQGVYTLQKINNQWVITRLEYGNMVGYSPQAAVAEPTPETGRDDGIYVLKIGNQHRYEEPWGWDRGDPCKAWETGDFDDTKPNYRGFNVELLLTNNSDTKVPDAWPITFSTNKGKSVKACYYGYEGSGPPPGATSSVTFFTVVEQGDFVNLITFSLNGQTVRLCLDGQGGSSPC